MRQGLDTRVRGAAALPTCLHPLVTRLPACPCAAWPALYDEARLRENAVPVAAATYYEARPSLHATMQHN